MCSHLDRRYPVRFAVVNYQVGNLPEVDRGPRAVCTGGSMIKDMPLI